MATPLPRLKDCGDDSPEAQRARDLLQAAEAHPASDLEQRRVFHRVLQERERRLLVPRAQLRLSRATGVLAFSCLLLCGAVAGATVARQPLLALWSWVASPPVATAPTTEKQHRNGKAPALAPQEPQALHVDEPVVPPLEAMPGPATPALSVRVPPKVRPSATAPAARQASPEAYGQLVLDATRALRQHGNAALALQAVGQYLEKAPRGSLVEEAYGIAMEAALLQGEDGVRWARLYLSRFPQGRFATQARKLVATPVSP